MPVTKKDTIEFTVRWAGQQKAHLLYLIDNGVPVVEPADEEARKCSITVKYEAGTSAARHFEWSIWFATKELSGLAAVASINGGPEQELDSADSQEHRWSSEGNARREVP